jgi:protein-L-isoaspartate(D-aspartate) O-methyltransferase
MSERSERFVAEIRRDGAVLSAELARAFGSVPREVFVGEGFQRRDGGWAGPGDADFLDLVYADDVLVTKLDGRTPVSSSSQPSLMAVMIEALEIGPGTRVLEIGAGTGYNAALMAALGAEVTSVDVQADVAARARAALRRSGVDHARVLLGDGYAGVPGERFDRVIVTVGVAGLSPRWLESLDGPGPVVAPIEHAGTQPVLVARRAAAPADPAQDVAGAAITASVLCPAGFMSASGPLSAEHPRRHPAPAEARSLAKFVPVGPARWSQPLSALAYRDLWYAAGVWNPRATHAALRGREQSVLALLDEARSGGAVILPDGAILAGGPEAARYAAIASGTLDRFAEAGNPAMRDWRIGLALAGEPAAPIWVPASWELRATAHGA